MTHQRQEVPCPESHYCALDTAEAIRVIYKRLENDTTDPEIQNALITLRAILWQSGCEQMPDGFPDLVDHIDVIVFG